MTDHRVPNGATWIRTWTERLRALRLNQHFPLTDRWVAWLPALPDEGELWLNAGSGQPAAWTWARARALHRSAAGAAVAWGQVSATPERDAQRARWVELSALPPPVRGNVTVDLRHRDAELVHLRLIVDWIDPRGGEISRYTVLAAMPHLGRAHAALSNAAASWVLGRLDGLGTADAGVVFGAMHQGGGFHVQEVVRGVIGPTLTPGVAGPNVLDGHVCEMVATACLERASVDLASVRVDDPLAASVVVGTGGGVEVSRLRKWSVGPRDFETLKSWLHAARSKNLVYGSGA